MRLHVLYRSTGPENRMSRPDFYSKLGCLKSFLAAAENCEEPVDLIFVNDGPMPQDRLELMQATGEVLQREGLGNNGSFHECLKQVDERGWPDDDLVYFVEDDYLHVPTALADLVIAAKTISGASYFGLYCGMDWEGVNHHQVGDQTWLTAANTTATFGAFAGALRSNRMLYNMAHHAGGAWDRDICMAYRGLRPRRWTELIGDLVGTEPGQRSPLERRVKRAIAQLLLNLHAMRRAFARQILVGPWPHKATHLSLPYLSPEVDWEAVASQASEWTPSTR